MALNNMTYNFSDFVGQKIFAAKDCYIYRKMTDKKAIKIIKKGQLIGVCTGYIFNTAQKSWWFAFKDSNGNPYGIPQDKKTNGFPQIDMSKLTDQLIKAGVKSREEQAAITKEAYDKSPITAAVETVKEKTASIFKNFGIYILAGAALLLLTRKK
tara:strand:- start:383 stop:847 length:465 start_codon:yes stop_codon:yes gene_type:complete